MLKKIIFIFFILKKYVKSNSVFIHTVSPELENNIDIIKDLYLNETNKDELNNTLNHLWYTESSILLKKNIEIFQSSPIFLNLCNHDNCYIDNIVEMDEIMYSNSIYIKDKSNNNFNYYGASSNYVKHRDCEICSFIFRDTSVYRVLIGLTNNNNHIITEFPDYNISKKINKGDVVGFDFDKTYHQVYNINNKQKEPRILLKLHFIVSNNSNLSKENIHFIKQFYIFYDRFLRIYTKIGTDPTNFYEFFIGLTSYFYYLECMNNVVIIYFLTSILILKLYNISILLSIIFFILIYIFICFCFWFRFILFHIK